MLFNSLPQVIILSDGVPSKNGGGISQTLYNLFNGYDSNKLVLLADKNEYVDKADNVLKGTIVKVAINKLPTIRNRFSTIINPIFFCINCWLREWGFVDIGKLYNPSNNSFLLVSTTHLNKLHYAYHFQKKHRLKLITYYMDNWVENVNTNWFTSNTQQLVSNTLHNATGLLFISKYLQQILIKKYSIPLDKPCMNVHNPVAISTLGINSITISQWENNKEIVIAYAGSIWPMHYDALLVVAKAIFILKGKGVAIQLQLFCANHFWKKYQQELEPLEVIYNGFIEYNNLNVALQESQFLLVASSFQNEFLPFSMCSIQTKITDYMKAGKPIISIGPNKGACNLFVEEYNCGYTVHSNNEQIVAQSILNIISNKKENYNKAINGFNTAYNNFRKEVVQPQLYNFISSLQ